MSTARVVPKRRLFQPLDPKRQGHEEDKTLPQLVGIVFDVDGTLCLPQNYMFQEMREALQIPKSTDILAHISSLAPSEQATAALAIQAIERRAMLKQTPSPGLSELTAYLDTRRVLKGICTRNFDAPVAHLLQQFLPDTRFEPVVTRAFEPPKPHPAGLLENRRIWEGVVGKEIPMVETVMVGDSKDDMCAGRRAGATTVLLVNEDNKELVGGEEVDCWIGRLDELVGRLEGGLESGGG